MRRGVLFGSILRRLQNVVPLVLVPAFLFAGHAAASAGVKRWAAMTITLTVLLVLLCALP